MGKFHHAAGIGVALPILGALGIIAHCGPHARRLMAAFG